MLAMEIIVTVSDASKMGYMLIRAITLNRTTAVPNLHHVNIINHTHNHYTFISLIYLHSICAYGSTFNFTKIYACCPR